MKICTKCGKKKPISEFFVNSKAKDKKQAKCKNCQTALTTKIRKNSRTTKFGHIQIIAARRRYYAKRQNAVFEVSLEYLRSIAPDVCPVLGIQLSWGITKDVPSDDSPSLDKIKPELGYIEGNVAWISNRANMIKSNATPEELRAIANWIETQ